jgi:hypothetical protein
MSFTAIAVNLRAISYQIHPVSRLETQRISGKTIGAMVTTIAIVCEFLNIEMSKTHSQSAEMIARFIQSGKTVGFQVM